MVTLKRLFLPLIAAALVLLAPQGVNMLTIKEHLINRFDQSGITHPTKPGEFSTAEGFYIHEGRPAVAEAWSANYYVGLTSGTLDTIYAGLPDYSTPALRLWIGEEGSALYAAWYLTTPLSQELTAAVSALGGQDKQNILLGNASQIFLIGSNGHVYAGAYTGALSDVYTTGDAWILLRWNNNVYLITTGGDLYLYGEASFAAVMTQTNSLRILFATPFRGYLLLAEYTAHNTITLHQLTNDYTLRTITQLTYTPYGYTVGQNYFLHGHAFAIHQGDIYFITRSLITNLDTTSEIQVHRFDGQQIEWVASVTTALSHPITGILSFRYDTLLVYAISASRDPTHVFYTLVGKNFIPLVSYTETRTTAEINVSQFGSQIALSRNGETYAEYVTFGRGALPTSTTRYPTTILETGWMDFDTATAKLLHTVTLQFTSDVTGISTTLYYKIDGAAAWTSLGATAAARAIAENINLEFHTLNIRAVTTLTAVTQAVELANLAIRYTRQ